MNYYEHHIGDYQRKTAHLSLAEHGAYSLMLQTFYASERPLPADRKVLYRLLRADTVAERKAIDSVTAQFWAEDSGGGLTNKRAEAVIGEYRAWVDKQKANGNRGGRPPRTHGLSEPKPNGNPRVRETLTETRDSHLRPPTSHLDHDLDTHTHTTSQAAPTGSRTERVGDFKKAGSGWRPPTNAELGIPEETPDA